MRKMFLATASAAALTLSVSAFAQDTGTTPVVPAPTVGNDQAGQTPDITNDRGQTQPSGGSTVNSTTGEITGADQGGSVGVAPDISNERGQTQPSGGSTVNSTTGAVTGADEGGSVGVTPDISNERGQTQPSGSSTVNSTTGAAAPTGCETTASTQTNQAQTSANC
jgi:hypothetical protein